MTEPKPRPTDSELEILNVLWSRGPSTVREVFAILGDARDVRYTTLLKQLQMMHEKGLAQRDESGRTHVYQAALRREEFAGDLMTRFFGGSLSDLMMSALSSRPADPEELRQIEELIAQHRQSKDKGGTP